MKQGRVVLVGAGPGDPGLITVAGTRALQGADVVLYDYLVHPSLLEHVGEGAELVYVGKKGGATYIPQDELTAEILRHARAGKTVVRLKGGDPFIFGRGGEEALACTLEGIPFEVVPGVSSAYGGPAYAGIPLTHRGRASAVTLITGHEDPSKSQSSVDWQALAKVGGTLTFLMSMRNLADVTGRLVKHGMAQDTPSAAVQWGTHPRQRTVTGTLEDLAERCEEAGLGAPAVVVVGPVVELRSTLSWFESRPLFGRRILITRAKGQAVAMMEKLRSLGADPVHVPMIRIADPRNPSQIREALIRVSEFDYVVFTSRNGVAYFFKYLAELGFDARSLGGVRVVAIGAVTADALREFGVLPDFQPKTYTSEALFGAMDAQLDLKGRNFLLPRADIAPPYLAESLTGAGAQVEEVEAYRTVPAEVPEADRERLDDLHGAAFLSSSSVDAFFKGPLEEDALKLLSRTIAFSIGPVTTATLRSYGVEPVEAEVHTSLGVVRSMVKHFRNEA